MITMITFLESAHWNTCIYWTKLKSNTYLRYSLKNVCLCSLVSPAQRPKNRDFRINTIFYIIFWKLEIILMQSDQEERSNPICEVISFDGRAGPKVSDFFEEILGFRGSIPNGGIIYPRTTILKFIQRSSYPGRRMKLMKRVSPPGYWISILSYE